MDLLLSGSEPPKPPESWMKRYLKPLIAGVAVVVALFLTISRRGPDGGLGVTTEKPSRAAPQRVGGSYDLSALNVFTKVLGRVKENYVEPQRIKPKQMLVSALDAIERNVAEVLAEESRDGNEVTVRVQDVERKFDVRNVDSPWSLTSKVKSVFRFIQPHLNPETEIQNVEYAATNGMLSTLDPHSILLKPDVYKEMKLSTRGQFGGLGIVISMIQGVLTVVNPMKGTPAAGVGIKSCDRILKIGDESTINMTLTQAVNRLRGEPGSDIEITIARGDSKKPQRKRITRAIIKVDSVTSRMLAQSIGYLRLSSFQGNSDADLRQHLDQLKRQGMRALVLDLRGNPGGLLDQAIKVADLFIDTGTLLTTVSHAGKRREEKRAKSAGTEGRYPIAVLVDGGSASASEIVAGALKHLDRAVVIGGGTFGKGSVQVLYDNDDGSALKLTIAQYLTPGDISIQTTGIIPDIATEAMIVRKEFIRLKQTDSGPRERDLSKHLTHKNVVETKPLRTVQYLLAPAQKDKDKAKAKETAESRNLCLFPDRSCEKKDEKDFVEDFQIRTARLLLAQTKGWRRSEILAGADAFFKKLTAQEETKVTKALSKLGVDWSASQPTQPIKRPKLAVLVTTEPKGKSLGACEESQIKVTVRNDGDAPLEQLHGMTVSPNDILADREMVFGRLEPGKSRSWTIPIKLRDAPTRMDKVTLKFTDAAGTEYPTQEVTLRTKGVERPVFAYSYQLVDDLEGNRDGQAQRGEQLRLFVKVKNTGKGAAYRTVTILKNLSGRGIFIRKGRFVLGQLKPGESKSASFTFDVQQVYAEQDFKLELAVQDNGLREFVSDKISFNIGAAGVAPTVAKGTVRLRKRTTFRSWPSDEAPDIGYAGPGSAFKLLGRLPQWVRVQAEDGRPAFVRADAVTSGGRAGRGRFEARWQVTPPKIALTVPRESTTDDNVRIRGVVTDETNVADVFVFVRNPEADVDGRKVFYLSNRGSKTPRKLGFSADVPLWPGTNYITVFARENNDVQSHELVVIYRRGGAKVAKKQGA